MRLFKLKLIAELFIKETFNILKDIGEKFVVVQYMNGNQCSVELSSMLNILENRPKLKLQQVLMRPLIMNHLESEISMHTLLHVQIIVLNVQDQKMVIAKVIIHLI
jgi:hypothetical protein